MTAAPAGRPAAAILGSVVVFALLVERAGFVPAVMATVLVAAAASQRSTARGALLSACALAAAMALLFVGLLDQPFLLVAGF